MTFREGLYISSATLTFSAPIRIRETTKNATHTPMKESTETARINKFFLYFSIIPNFINGLRDRSHERAVKIKGFGFLSRSFITSKYELFEVYKQLFLNTK